MVLTIFVLLIASILQTSGQFGAAVEMPEFGLIDAPNVQQHGPDVPSDSTAYQELAAPFFQEDRTIDVELVDEWVDAAGRWLQTLRLTIKAGGTLADASEVLYGDQGHNDEMFEAARRLNPELRGPQFVPIGQQLEVTVQAANTFVVRQSTADPATGRTVNTFFNGAQEIIYPRATAGLLRIVDFPADKRASFFAISLDNGNERIPGGSRLAEYRYRQGDAFDSIVKAIYGIASVRAMQDFMSKTQWTPDQWPPKSNEVRRVIVSTIVSWEDEKIVPLEPASSGTITNQKLAELNRERMAAGIYHIETRGSGTSFRIRVTDPRLTARDVARLLYNSDENYLSVATKAGIAAPVDGGGNVPESFDPRLLGRVFDVQVDYVDERFLVDAPARDFEIKGTVTRLVNGTIIVDYDLATGNESGLNRVVYYPTGYKKIAYRLSDTLSILTDFLHFVLGRPSDGQDQYSQNLQTQEFVATTIWNWMPGLPREAGDILEESRMVEVDNREMLEVVIAPGTQTGIKATIFYSWWIANPCLTLLTIVFFASIIVLTSIQLFRRMG